jgi:O-antigen ligase
LPLPLVVAAAAGLLVVLLIRLEPVLVVLGLAAMRAPLEGMQDKVLFKAGHVGLSPTDLLSVAFLAGVTWWLVSEGVRGNPFWRAPSILPAVFLLGVSVFSLAYSPAKLLGARDLVKWSAGFCAYPLLLAARPDPARLRQFLGLILASSVIPIAVGWWQFAHSVGKPGLLHGGLRIQSVFEHPNTFGFYLLAVVVAAWGLHPYVTGLKRRLVQAVMLTAFLSTAITLGRSTWVAAGILVLVVGWRHRRILIWVAAIGAVVVAATPRLVERATDLFNPRTGANRGNSLEGRLSIWSGEIKEWGSRPFLGHGWGYTLSAQDKASHNDFLRMLVEVGVVGFLAIVMLILSLIRWTWRAGRGRIDLPRAFFGLAIGYAIQSGVSNTMGKGVYQFYFWLLAGISAVWATTVPPITTIGRRPVEEHALDNGT